MWDMEVWAMQSKCKVGRGIFLACPFGDAVYLFYQHHYEGEKK